MLSLERLRTLHAVATHGSLNAAAQFLNVTTSAVSQAISKLEEEVGEQLLERRGRGVGLTDAATLLSAHAARALSMLAEAEAELDARRGQVAGQLTVGAFATGARGLAPAVLRLMNEAHPDLLITLHEMEPDRSIPLLDRGVVDLVVAQDWANAPLALPEGLVKAPLLDDVADIALPSGHRLAAHRTIALDDLAGEPWITWPSGSICHDWLMQTLRRHGHDPIVRHTAIEYATQLALVAAGLGASVLPRLGRGAVPAGVSVVGVTPALHRHVYAIWRADASRRTAITAAVEAFTLVASTLRDRGGPSLGGRATKRRPTATSSRLAVGPGSRPGRRRLTPGDRARRG
ncbi:MAG TPA: LysR substrate-binding domain-containing protein [Vicinamibacteria bacterium]